MAKKSNTSGSKPKRVRRKCSHPNCVNRVVQGGVCVAHGARRKLCSHPGCSKAVKVAGFCSAHGPARRKCDYVGPPDHRGVAMTCSRVAVQGGKCLSHGARRRVCAYPGGTCVKNAILGGMCKKHHDKMRDAEGMLQMSQMSLCVPVAPPPTMTGGTRANTQAAAAAAASRGGLVGSHEGAASGGASVARSLGSLSFSEGSVGEFSEEESRPTAAVFCSPSWGSADAAPAPASSHAGMVAGRAFPASASAPDLKSMDRPSVDRPSVDAAGHQRGLSIFDEMPTVDAIINSGQGKDGEVDQGRQEQRHVPGQGRPAGREGKSHPVKAGNVAAAARPDQPPRPTLPPLHPATVAQMPAQTPVARTSYADGPRAPGGILRRPSPRHGGGTATPPCTGNASCTCDACRSPTLAIFEQMIVASQKLENGGFDPQEFEGLSPPKLGSPRKGGAAGGALATPRSVGKQVSFLPDEPNSTGSVVRMVSSNNIAGQGQGPPEEEAARREHHQGKVMTHQDYNQYIHQVRQEHPQERLREGPASQAVKRTVSRDVDNGRHHPPSTYEYHYQHSNQGTQVRGVQYGVQYPPQQAPHLSSRGQSRHGHRRAPVPPEFHPPQTAFHPPQTPTLYDQEYDPSTMPVASSASSSVGEQQLLLKPRGDRTFQHLFVPNEG